jgi:hypothetical protein
VQRLWLGVAVKSREDSPIHPSGSTTQPSQEKPYEPCPAISPGHQPPRCTDPTGAGLTVSGGADAALIITDINQTISAGEELFINLDGIGNDEFRLFIDALPDNTEVSPFFRRRAITTGNDGRLMPDSYWLFLL